MAVLHAGEGMGWNVGHYQTPPCALSTTASRTFLSEILRAGAGSDVLYQLLCDTVFEDEDVLPDPCHLVIYLQKTPHDFVSWLERNLGHIRRLGIHLTVRFVCTADAFPAPWTSFMRYWYSP